LNFFPWKFNFFPGEFNSRVGKLNFFAWKFNSIVKEKHSRVSEKLFRARECFSDGLQSLSRRLPPPAYLLLPSPRRSLKPTRAKAGGPSVRTGVRPTS
jgi:hypothetical protein